MVQRNQYQCFQMRCKLLFLVLATANLPFIVRSDMWDNLPSDDVANNLVTTEPAGSNKSLGELLPHQLIGFENKVQAHLMNQTSVYAATRVACEEIVITAYKVADYVPAMVTEKQREFWHKTVIPILVDTLTQDVKAQAEVSTMFTAIRDLAVVIQRNYEIIRRSRGNPKAIGIARRNIPEALRTLQESKARAKNLSSSAILNFADTTNEIFQIIGPLAANFTQEKEKIFCNIKNERKKQQDFIAELAAKQGEVNRYFLLIEASEKQLSRTEVDLNAAQKRIEGMNKLNHDMEITLQNIPADITKTVRERGSSGWWIFSSSYDKTTTTQEANPDRERTKRFYENIILARKERIKASEADKGAIDKAMADLKANMATYNNSLTTAMQQLNFLRNKLEENLNLSEVEINRLKEENERVDNSSAEIFDKVGLRGDTLIACLVHVRSFAKSNKNNSAYDPIHSILSGVEKMVKSKVEMLEDDTTVFLACTMLIEEVNFLMKFVLDAEKILRPPKEYNIKQLEEKINTLS